MRKTNESPNAPVESADPGASLSKLLSAPKGKEDGTYKIDAGDGVVLTAKYLISQSKVFEIAESSEMRQKVAKTQAFKCESPDGEVIEIKASSELISMATMMEKLIVEPKITFGHALIMAERNWPRFIKIASAMNDANGDEDEELGNSSGQTEKV
jgi:hypothetical protein